MALNLKRMVNTIFRYFQIYCSAGTTVGSSRIFAFVNRSKSWRDHYVAHNVAHGRNYSKPKQKRFYQKQEKPWNRWLNSDKELIQTYYC